MSRPLFPYADFPEIRWIWKKKLLSGDFLFFQNLHFSADCFQAEVAVFEGKNLTLLIPANLADHLQKVKIDNVSAAKSRIEQSGQYCCRSEKQLLLFS